MVATCLFAFSGAVRKLGFPVLRGNLNLKEEAIIGGKGE
jgi:hypothetical protein